jgi:hypothetical protein
MDPILVDVCKSLDSLSDKILKAYSDDRTMTEIWGWNLPPLSRHDLASLPQKLSDKIKQLDLSSIDEDLKEELEEIPERIKVFEKHSLQYLFNGNGAATIPLYMSLIDWINFTIKPLFSWQVLLDNKALSNQLARRLRSIQAELNELVPEKEELKRQIQLIDDATSAAESLPTDLESLRQARNKVDKLSTDSAELFGKIDTYHKNADETSKSISNKKHEADKLVQQCEEAYRITTTKGLAAAFDQRANRLGLSMAIWVLGLLAALGFGAYIGSHRVELLSKAIYATNPQWGVIWMNLFLSILSIGAPIWFAWISTKQISQRFRLSEDYAFKASVAKAYEGYRKEAARIDPAFEARLFSSALSRLEEAPLRLMEQDTHGSPWHELVSSPQFQKALQSVPELRDKFIDIAKNGIDVFKSKKSTAIQSDEVE